MRVRKSKQTRKSGYPEKRSFLGKRSGNPQSEAVFKRKRRTHRIRRDVADRVGFEPTSRLRDYLISSVLGLREVMRDNVKLGETKCI